MRKTSIVALVLLFATLTAKGAGEACPPCWAYDRYISEWKINSPVCGSGTRQSPVDLGGAVAAPPAELIPDYHTLPFTVRNTGRTAEVDAVCCANGVWYKGVRYNVVNVHFHAPAEHKINGHADVMEAHVVHQTSDGKRLVIAVLYELGTSNSALSTIINILPENSCQTGRRDGTFVPSQIIPWRHNDNHWYTYEGSLTTPNCEENVTFLVFERKGSVSQGDVDKLRRIFGNNARPIQPLNGRVVTKQ